MATLFLKAIKTSAIMLNFWPKDSTILSRMRMQPSTNKKWHSFSKSWPFTCTKILSGKTCTTFKPSSKSSRRKERSMKIRGKNKSKSKRDSRKLKGRMSRSLNRLKPNKKNKKTCSAGLPMSPVNRSRKSVKTRSSSKTLKRNRSKKNRTMMILCDKLYVYS